MKTYDQFTVDMMEGDIDRGRHAWGFGRKKTVWDFSNQRARQWDRDAKPSENTNKRAPESNLENPLNFRRHKPVKSIKGPQGQTMKPDVI